MERREFLATALVAPAALVSLARLDSEAAPIPEVCAIVPPLPPVAPEVAPASTYWIRIEEDSSGNRLPAAACATKQQARGRHHPYTDPIKRVPFKPLTARARYRIAEIEWLPQAITWERNPKRAIANDRAFERALLTYADPTSLVAVPSQMHGHNNQWFVPANIYERGEGLAKVARMNAEKADEYGGEPNMRFARWAILVELGRSCIVPDLEFEVASNGMDTMKLETQRPVRVVYPTPQELERYPMPAKALTEGGAV